MFIVFTYSLFKNSNKSYFLFIMLRNKFSDVPLKPSGRKIHNKGFGEPREKQKKSIEDISRVHIESFNFILSGGLGKAVQNIYPVEMQMANGDHIKVEIKDCMIGFPVIHKNAVNAKSYKVYPTECRQRGVSYKGKLELKVTWSKNEEEQETMSKIIGEVPIMVKSDACNLKNLSPRELVQHKEDEGEFGGYFIINGKERIIRMLIMQRRNYPIAMTRLSWKKRGGLFTEYGVSVRCVRSDQTGNNMVLHYLSNGTAELMFTHRRELYFSPIVLILKALCDVPDYYIYTEMIKGRENDTCYQIFVKTMLGQLNEAKLYSQSQIWKYMGEAFRVRLRLPPWYTNEQLVDFILKNCICVHLDCNTDKFDFLVYMTRKLYAVAKGGCALESVDNPMNQEILLPGHTYLIVLKEKLESWLNNVKVTLERKLKSKGSTFKITNSFMSETISAALDLTRAMDYFLATGTFVSRSNSSLGQFSGLTVVADKLNYLRYISHFRCVHRGSFFAEMRTTEVRKLYPEAWGFLCPVHTPDGAPCGLLNHLAEMCEVVNIQPAIGHLSRLLFFLGVFPYHGPIPVSYADCYCVQIDGKIIGWVKRESAHELVVQLRYFKSLRKENVPSNLEIAYVPAMSELSQYPGLFIFSTPARMMRPVINLYTKEVELIGSMEQAYLDICCSPSEYYKEITTHQELSKTCMLSIVANMIPFSDFNPSPRNMYQCQMSKQTMGTPCHALKYRTDNKLYRLQYPQSPFVRPALYDYYNVDDYPLGTNAIVAVISCTGYDMEDAIVLNKSSVERGFEFGSIYKSEYVNLKMISGDRGSLSLAFGRKATDKHLEKHIDLDGLPYIGTRLEYGDPMCSYYNIITMETKVQKYKSTEAAYVYDVKLLGNDTGTSILQNVCITFWIPRKPSIGDKFASRHGQKGVCSSLLPVENMPFTESGMIPDILFNPHGFPSRMTVGMAIESMAGKSAAIHGLLHDCTPFTSSEEEPSAEHFGKLLTAGGYNYVGAERMYDGSTGVEMEADIYIGIVYYQRLRHMVSDKYQVRTLGPIDILTHQPVKGRKRDGGVRFGEMERDSLISHGSAYLLQDRLINCSDKALINICTKCESVLSPIFDKPTSGDTTGYIIRKDWTCNVCDSGKNIEVLHLPYSFYYLISELASMNVQVKVGITK